jgi:hypothetical protein
MAALYTAHAVRGDAVAPAPDLPTWSDLNTWQKTELSIDHVAVALQRLGAVISKAGLTPPGLDDVRRTFGGTDKAALTAAIFDLHGQLFRALHATDANLGKAYDLGRSLAYTCSRPKNGSDLRKEFQEARLANLKGWLADLATALPDHSARAVSISLGIWQEAIPDPGADPESWQYDDSAEAALRQQLHRQASVWRAVLTGAKNGRDMLAPIDYVTAAGRLFRHGIGVVWRFLYKTYFAVPVVLAVGAFAVWAILHSQGKTGTQVVGAIAAAATALGISWKGTEATLGRIAGKLEPPLWNTELDTSIGSAMTTLDRKPSAPSSEKIATQISPPSGPLRYDSPNSGDNRREGSDSSSA